MSTESAASHAEPPAGANHSHHGGRHDEHGVGASDAIELLPHQHAFFVVGTRDLFLVHQGNMWMEPHRYQVVMRIALPADVQTELLSDRTRHPDAWYIIGNKSDAAFALPTIPQGARTSFTGSVWRGWPTQPGTEHWPWANTPPVIARFEVSIAQIVYYRHLDFNLDYPRTATYLLFGRGTEAHLYHLVTQQPDYDHVASLVRAPSWLPAALLETGVFVNFPSIPALPGGHELRFAVYTENPIANGTHYVQFSGYGPRRQLDVDRTVFFGTWPINSINPKTGKAEP